MCFLRRLWGLSVYDERWLTPGPARVVHVCSSVLCFLTVCPSFHAELKYICKNTYVTMFLSGFRILNLVSVDLSTPDSTIFPAVTSSFVFIMQFMTQSDIYLGLWSQRACLIVQLVKTPPANAGDPSSIPGSGRSSEEGIGYPLQYSWASLLAQLVKNSPTTWETWVRSLGWEDPLEKEMATYSSIPAWRIWWTV